MKRWVVVPELPHQRSLLLIMILASIG